MGKPFGIDTVVGITGTWPERQQTARWQEIADDRRGQIAQACLYREEMIADGWIANAQYPHEPIEHAAKLTKECFICHLIARPEHDRSLPCASATFWGPDGVSIEAPYPYNWQFIFDGLRRCPECNATDVDTVRVAFANRACNNCAPALRESLERPGWCD